MTEVDRIDSCPSSEQIAAYAEDRLSAAQRAAIDAHLADCDMCRELYANVWQLLQEPLPEPQSGSVPAVGESPAPAPAPAAKEVRWWERWQMYAATGGALAAAAILAIVIVPEWNPLGGPTPYEELVAAVGTNRTVEARLTGGFRYARLRSPTRAGDSSGSDNYELLAAAARIRQMVDASSGPEILHALGVAHLVQRQVDDGVRVLEQAARAAPQDPEIKTDLAAAYLARGSGSGGGSGGGSGRDDDAQRAFDAASQAVDLNPRLPEALFNRALAGERLLPPAEAKRLWAEYLRVDGSGPWADEAQERLGALGGP